MTFGGALAATLVPRIGPAGSVALRLVLLRCCWRWPAPVAPSQPGGLDHCLGVRRGPCPDATAASHAPLALGRLASTASRSTRRYPAQPSPAHRARTPAQRDHVAYPAPAGGPRASRRLRGVPPRRPGPGRPYPLALAAGACWAAYILLSARTGTHFAQLDGLAIAMAIAAVLVAPLGLATAGTALFTWDALWRGAGIALLSSGAALLPGADRAAPALCAGVRGPVAAWSPPSPPSPAWSCSARPCPGPSCSGSPASWRGERLGDGLGRDSSGVTPDREPGVTA